MSNIVKGTGRYVRLSNVNAVNCERGARVVLDGEYEVIERMEGRNDTVILSLLDPNEKHPGGSDGLTMLPCTLRTQVDAGRVVDVPEPVALKRRR